MKEQRLFLNSLSIRDHIAHTSTLTIGDAFVALGFHDVPISKLESKESRLNAWEKLAEMKYEYADAMLALSHEFNDSETLNIFTEDSDA